MKKTKKWILIVLIPLVLVIGVVLWFNAKGENVNSLEKEKVTRGDLKKTISVTGALISKSPVVLSFEGMGRISSIKVKVGDKVIEGDVLAVLDNNILGEQVKKTKAALDKAMMIDKMNNDSAREAAERVDDAEDYLDAMEEYHDQLIAAANTAYENATDYKSDAESYYNQVVSDSGVGSKEAKSALLTLTTADNSKKATAEGLKTTRKSKDLNIISAENSLNTAEEGLKTVESDYAESSRNAAVVAAQADYQIALKSLSESSLKSPLNGVISKINYEQGEVLGSSNLGSSFGEMITNDFILEADIPESDISEIKLGQVAEVTFDAFDYNEKFTAKLIEIEPASTNIQDVIYYKSKLKIEGSALKFKEGMSADIDILVDSKDDVLKVPGQFVSEKEERKSVLMEANDELIEVEIKTNLISDDGYVEILAGLKEGDEVYLREDE